MKPGLYTDIPFSDYLALPAMSNTSLGWMERSPAYYRWRSAADVESKSHQRVGSAADLAVLGPGELEDEFCYFEGDRRTKAGKEAYAAAVASGRAVLSRAEWDKALGIAASVRSTHHIRNTLAKLPQRQVTLVWEERGQLCKARPDACSEDCGVILDMKTTRDLPRFAPYELTKHGYHRQAGWYTRGARALGFNPESFLWLAVANTAPYEAELYRADDDTVRAGEQEATDLLEQWRACNDADSWPGGRAGLLTAHITDWKMAEIFPEES